jgi:hypothetical protein
MAQIYTGVLSCTNIPRLVNIIKNFLYEAVGGKKLAKSPKG